MRHRLWLALVLAAMPCLGAEAPKADREVAVRLKDGSTLVGRIVSEDETRLKVVTRAGVEVEVPRTAVASVEEAGKAAAAKAPAEPVVDDTRLFFGPTGRPLRKGAGYFSDHEIFFPGVAYGVTDNVTLAGGVSVIPSLDLGEQAFYFTPKIGARLGDRAAFSVGGLFAHAGGGDGGSLSIGYAVGTWGSSDNSISAGVGLARTSDDDDYDYDYGYDYRYDYGAYRDDRDEDPQPILMVGGSARLSRRLSLITENWFFPGEDVNVLSGGLRFRGDRLTVDFGLVTSGEILDETEGLPFLPWLSFSYHFSPPRSRK